MKNCPKCSARHMTTRWHSSRDNTLCCLSCGYEVVTIPQDVLDEVHLSYGKERLLSTGVALKLLATQSKS